MFAPYQLDPGTPPEGKPVRRMTPPDAPPTALEQRGTSLGIKFSRGRTHIANSHLALEVDEFAAEHGLGWQFHRAMFKAYFEDLRDIGSIDTVVEIGAAVGLPEGELRAALEGGRYRESVDEGVEWSRQIGVSAVPTFIFAERYGVVGAQEYPVFRQMMTKLGREPKA
jgi:predicted DsbA family dithiol-disulfide isomerase